MPTAVRRANLACGAVLRGGARWWVVAQVVPTGVVMCPQHLAPPCGGGIWPPPARAAATTRIGQWA